MFLTRKSPRALARFCAPVLLIAAGMLAGCQAHHRPTTAPVALRPIRSNVNGPSDVITPYTPAAAPLETSAIPIGAVGQYRNYFPITCWYQNGNVMAGPNFKLANPVPPVNNAVIQEASDVFAEPLLVVLQMASYPIWVFVEPGHLRAYDGFKDDATHLSFVHHKQQANSTGTSNSGAAMGAVAQ